MSKNNEDQQKLDRRSFLKFGTLLPAAGLALPTLRAAESCQSTTPAVAFPASRRCM